MVDSVSPEGWTPGGPLTVEKLTVEYADRPLGTDVTRPRLAWIASAPGYGATQSAYQILIASSLELLETADVWDSGKVASAQSFGIEYDGPGLAPRTRYHWAVRLWDGLGRIGELSKQSWFETGLLDEGFGDAVWIGARPEVRDEDVPAPLLRRAFTLTAPVERARLYASGLAYQELRLNGQRGGDSVLDPGFTDYDDTVLYVTHDVTGLLRSGDNVRGAELGRGFFGLSTPNTWRWHQTPWNAEPRLLARLVIEHADGTVTEIRSDDSWRVADGPTLSDSLFCGETYDARLHPAGWDEPGFDDTSWRAALVLPAPRGHVRAQEHEPIRVIEDVAPVSFSSPRSRSPRPGRVSGWLISAGPRPAGPSFA